MSWLVHLGAGISALFISLAAFFGFGYSVTHPTTQPVANGTETTMASSSRASSVARLQTTSVWVPVSDSRNSEYTERAGKIYWSPWWNSGSPTAVTGASEVTFRVLVDLLNATDTPMIAKDSRHVYVGAQVVNDADAQTFSAPDDANGAGDMRTMSIFIDKNHVYGDAAYGQQPLLAIIPLADPSTFVFLGFSSTNGEMITGSYYRDQHNVYFSSVSGGPGGADMSVIKGADANTFALVSPGTGPFGAYATMVSCGTNCQYDAQDKNHKYLNGQVVQ